MKTSSICRILCACVLLLVLCVASTVAAPPKYYSLGNVRLPKRQPATECDSDQVVSHICYQCGKSHVNQFYQIYNACCRGQIGTDVAVRKYCGDIYTEPPKRGGLWL